MEYNSVSQKALSAINCIMLPFPKKMISDAKIKSKTGKAGFINFHFTITQDLFIYVLNILHLLIHFPCVEVRIVKENIFH
jgi:hypothetical protein